MDKLREFRILQLLVASGDYNSERFRHTDGYKDEIHFDDNRSLNFYKIYRKDDKIYIDSVYYEGNDFSPLIGNIDKIESAEELLSNPAFLGCIISKQYSAYYFNKYEKTYELTICPNLFIRVSCIDDNTPLYRGFYFKFRKSTNTSTCTFDEFVNVILRYSSVKSARN